MEPQRFHVRRSTIALSIKAMALLLATVAIYFQDLAIVANQALRDEAASYIIAIPFLLIYLLYRKRKMLRAAVSFEPAEQPKETKHLATIAGILVSTVAILLYWYGSYTFTPLEYHMASLPIFVAGLTLIFFNPQTLRQLAFPVAFLILLMPPPSVVLYGLGATLSVVSAEVSNTAIMALGIPSTLSSEYGNPSVQITRPNGATISFAVDIACSGVYSLIGFLIFAVFIVYIIRDKMWKRAVIFPIGLLLIYLLNITRITVILLIGYHYGEEAALQIFHLLGGWVLLFLGTMLLLAVTEKILRTRIFIRTTAFMQCQHNSRPSNDSQNFCFSCGKLLKYPKAKLKKQDVAKILVTALAVALLLSIQAPVFALTQGPAEIILQTPAGEQATTQVFPQIEGYTLKFIFRDRQFEQLSKQDASLIYAYIPQNKTDKIIWITIEIASTLSLMHGWEFCLVTLPQSHGYQPKVTPLDLRDMQILENPPIIAKYFAFQNTETNQTQAVIYWHEKSAFKTNTTSEQKYVEISVIAYLNSKDTILGIEDKLATIATTIAKHWQPIKTWTQMAILISQNGDTLIVIIIGLLTLVIGFYVLERRRERKTNTHTYQKLSNPNKHLIDTIYMTEKTGTPILNAIAVQYQGITGETIEKEKLFQKLVEVEKTGIIRSKMTNQYDEPFQTWKTQMVFTKTWKSDESTKG